MDSGASTRIVKVRSGRIKPSGSWLYVWIDVDLRRVVYVGGTGLDPELRAYVHLTDDDPDLGRVKALLPDSSKRSFDILAFPVPDGIDRPDAKQALLGALAAAGLLESDEAGHHACGIVEPMVAELVAHISTLSPAALWHRLKGMERPLRLGELDRPRRWRP